MSQPGLPSTSGRDHRDHDEATLTTLVSKLNLLQELIAWKLSLTLAECNLIERYPDHDFAKAARHYLGTGRLTRPYTKKNRPRRPPSPPMQLVPPQTPQQHHQQQLADLGPFLSRKRQRDQIEDNEPRIIDPLHKTAHASGLIKRRRRSYSASSDNEIELSAMERQSAGRRNSF